MGLRMTVKQRSPRKIGLCLLIALALIVGFYYALDGEREQDSVVSILEVPSFGKHLASLQPEGLVHYAWHRTHRGSTCVVSGVTSKEAFDSFCERYKLDRRMSPVPGLNTYYADRVLNLGADPTKFFTKFVSEDVYAVGRERGVGNIQASYNGQTSHFLVEILDYAPD